MIATRLGLAVTAAIACLLAIVLALDLRRDTAPPDRAIAPGFDAATVTELAWRDRMQIARDPKSPTGWSWRDPAGSADARAIEAIFSTLRGAHWHRRADASAAGAIGDVLTVTGGTELRIAIGQPIAGTEQQWIVIDDRALLVDAWVVRSLVPAPLALRVRAPLAAAAEASEIELDPGVRVRGTPRRLVASSDGELLLAPGFADDLEAALAGIVVVELPRAPIGTPHGVRVLLDGKLVVAGAGPCPGSTTTIAIDGVHGQGCVDGQAWSALLRASDAMRGPLEAVVERRPAPGLPARITLADGAIVDLVKRPRVGDRDADPERITELLAVLGLPGEPVPLPATKPTGSLVVAGHVGPAVTLDLYPGGVVARRGEPIALRIGDGSVAILARPGAALRDPTLWSEEPTTITAIAIDGTTYTRGKVVGEWTRSGAGRDDPATLDKLAGALASPRGLGPRKAATTAPRHALTITITPPAGPRTSHAIALEPSGTECIATVEGASITVAAELCQLVTRLRP